MGEDKYEYGRISDLAYTSRHGYERGIPRGKATPGEKQKKLQARRQTAKHAKEAKKWLVRRSGSTTQLTLGL